MGKRVLCYVIFFFLEFSGYCKEYKDNLFYIWDYLLQRLIIIWSRKQISIIQCILIKASKTDSIYDTFSISK